MAQLLLVSRWLESSFYGYGEKYQQSTSKSISIIIFFDLLFQIQPEPVWTDSGEGWIDWKQLWLLSLYGRVKDVYLNAVLGSREMPRLVFQVPVMMWHYV